MNPRPPEPHRFRIRRPEAPTSWWSTTVERCRRRVLERLAPSSPLARAGRIGLLTLLAWFSLRHLADPAFHGIYGALNLVLHEAGHLVFMWSGSDWMTAAGGTLFHLMCVATVGVVFWRQRDPFAVAVVIWWAGTVFVGAGHYAADARRQLLPLVTVGDGPAGHDWYTILDGVGLLAADQQVGWMLRTGGLLLLAAGVAAGAWTVWDRPRNTGRHGEEGRG